MKKFKIKSLLKPSRDKIHKWSGLDKNNFRI